MSEIELVIKIPEEDFERCKKRFQMRINVMGDAIANGTPLPKGHGRLIDAKDVGEYLTLADVPTIIEANEKSEE